MKKILSLLLALTLVGCTATQAPTPTPEESKKPSSNVGCDVTSECEDGEKADMSAYKDFMDTDHVFRSITMQQGNELLESDKTFVLYYGFSTCPWCVELLPILNDVAKENGMAVEYVNVRPEGTDSTNDIRVDTNPDYVKLTEIVNDYLPVNDEGVKRLSVPFVFFVKDGEIVETHIGTLDSHDAKERVMNDEEKAELTQIMIDNFQKMKK
ncbi:TlpA family protein disulfide reductase [Anaerorhabdus sp.]|uniref:TlpA family protein disulfide reductase n=1 Tax=Anaerorhabdus sp. TaxID=1872524 RepID=UPI002FCB701A